LKPDSRGSTKKVDMPDTTEPSASATDANAAKNAKNNKKDPKGKAVDPPPGNKDEEVAIPVTRDDLDEEQLVEVDKAMNLFQTKILSTFTKNRSSKVLAKGAITDPLMSDVDLTTPLEKRSPVLREVVNEMVGHALSCQGKILVNSLQGIVREVVKENKSGETSNQGPTFGTYDGERSLFKYQPKEDQIQFPSTKVQYVLYPIGGSVSECQFYDDPPRIIPEGFRCEVQLVLVASTEPPRFETPKQHDQQLTLGGTTKAKDTASENQEWQRRYDTLASQTGVHEDPRMVDQLTAVLRDRFSITPKGKAIGYVKPYLDHFDLISQNSQDKTAPPRLSI
jgi:hypothetical protein